MCTHKSENNTPSNNTDQTNNNTSGANKNTPTTAAMTTGATSATTSLHIAGDNVCLLKTAVANVYANDTGIEANILLDGNPRDHFSQKD